jgi:hypothetical protein
MGNIGNLIPGRGARDIRASKVRKVLEFGYKVQLLTSRLLMRLLNTSQSNGSTLLKELEDQELIRSINIKHSISAPRGRAYLLTARGVAVAVRDLPGPLHKYDHRLESVRLDQSEHDLQLAEFAADWVCGGATIEQTDFMQRQSRVERGQKIPDLVLCIGKVKVAVEYERLSKSGRELDQMIASAMHTSTMRTIWFFEVRETYDLFQSILTGAKLNDWGLNSSNKWVRDGELFVPIGWRKRQLALHLAPGGALGHTPSSWLEQFDELDSSTVSRAAASWRAKGWRWGCLVETELGIAFALFVQNAEHDMQLMVFLCEPNHWYVCAAGMHPESGHKFGEAKTIPSVMNVDPDFRVIERAIRKVREVNFDFEG